MKILLVNVVYGIGSTGSITKSLYEEYKRMGNDVRVIYGRKSIISNSDFVKGSYDIESKIFHFISLFSGNLYGGMPLSTHKIIRYIKKYKPDVIHLHCLNGYFVNIYKLLRYIAKNKIKTILTMHADFMMTGGCGISVDCEKHIFNQCKKCPYVKEFNGKFSLNRTNHFYKKMQKSIKLFQSDLLRVTCVSPWLEKRYSLSPIYKGKSITTILNPVNEDFFTKSKINPYVEKKNILYVTPDINDHVKCGWLISEIANKRRDLHFTIICAKDTEFNTDCENITFLSNSDRKINLKDYYCFADGTLILSKRETFSMVVAESLVCGTPVYGFEAGGPETICIEEYCKFYKHGNISDLSNSLASISKNNLIEIKAKEKYDLSNIAKAYLSLF